MRNVHKTHIRAGCTLCDALSVKKRVFEPAFWQWIGLTGHK
jgi:hypothetical protein